MAASGEVGAQLSVNKKSGTLMGLVGTRQWSDFSPAALNTHTSSIRRKSAGQSLALGGKEEMAAVWAQGLNAVIVKSGDIAQH